MLKGTSMKDAKFQAHDYIEQLDFIPKTNAKADTLSGGMKRKLHLGIALVGDSKVVMLDEPTGDSNGTYKGKKYFEAMDKCGAFVRPNELQVGDFPEKDMFDELEDEI